MNISPSQKKKKKQLQDLLQRDGDSFFGEKEQARLLAGEQLPCLLLVCLTS